MYKAVEDYMDKLNDMMEDASDVFLENAKKEECIEVRNEALAYLNEVFYNYNWSEEFVICFAVYCNFFILHGLHIALNNDFGLEKIYNCNHMNLDDRQYLDYIYQGIFEQDTDYFERAIQMNLYDFDIPQYYLYVLSFLELCLRENEDYESDEGREDIYIWYSDMEAAKNAITGDLRNSLEPSILTFGEEAKLKSDYSILLPRIIVSNATRQLALAANSDLEELSRLSGVPIENFSDILKGFQKVAESQKIGSGNGIPEISLYTIFADEFVKRMISAKECGDYDLYYGKHEEIRDGAPIGRREFLMLPVNVSENQYRNLALAKQVKLNFEKELLIQKNERMVEDYSHSVENIMKPALIAEVANCLRQDEKYRDIYSKIMYSYYNEVITQNECRLLKMVHNISVPKGAIRESISRAKQFNDGNKITIERLAYKAVNQIALQLAEDSEKARYMFIMNKMSQAGIDSKMLDDKLWEASKEFVALYELFYEKLNFIINIERKLKNFCLNEEEIGTSFLYSRIVELFTNALTYGDYSEDKMFTLDVYLDEDAALDKYLIFEMTNKIGDRSFSDNRTGNGLNATVTMLERINRRNPEMEYFLIAGEKEEAIYVTRMYIDADLYLEDTYD